MVDRGDNRTNERPAERTPWTGKTVLLLVAITVVAAAVRLFRVEIWSLNEVEAGTWRAITAPLGGDRGFCVSPEGCQPLAYLLLRQLFDFGLLGGGTEGWLRLPFVFCGAATVPLFALAMARHTGRAVALLAAAMLAVHPWHVCISQSADPRAPALLLIVVAVIALRHDHPDARRRGWVHASLALLAAGLCHPLGWCCALVVFLLVTLRRWGSALRNERLLRGLGAALLLVVLLRAVEREHAPLSLAGWLGLPQAGLLAAGLPLLAFAGAGLLLVRPMPRGLWFGALLPIALVPMASTLGGAAAADIAAAALLPLLVAAASLLQHAYTCCRAAAGPSLPWLAVLPAVLAISLPAVETFLYATMHSGHRAPWRQAAATVLQQVRGAGSVVAAGVGEASLCYYLLPNHWRQPSAIAHESLRLTSLTPDLAAAVAALPADVDFVVLREDERRAALADPAAAAVLAGCRLLRVLPASTPAGDDTITVYHRAAAR